MVGVSNATVALVTAEPTSRMTIEEWLAYEETTDDRHELIDGRLVLDQGGTERHDLLIQAIFERLVGPFRQQRCTVFVHNRKVVVPKGDGYYPDLVVRCGPRTDDRYDTTPTWAFEVLSPSNRPQHMLRKLSGYTSIPSLEGYVVLDAETQDVRAYVRAGDVWHTLDVTARQLPVGPVLLDFAEVFAAVEQDLALGE